jgi:hypothetical protein
LEELFNKLDIPLVSIKGGVAERRVVGSKDSPTVVRSEAGDFTISNNPAPECPEMSRLRCIFWNSNGWDGDKAQRVSELAKNEDANVICLLDTKQDEISVTKKISALSFYLHLRTGKNWTGKYSPTLSNIKVGGSIIMVSDQAIVKSHKSIITGGIMDEINVQWGKNTVKIVSVYRPADEKGTGSLRKAINKICGGDLDLKFSEALSHIAGNSHTIIGGDFNLEPDSVARLLLKSGLRGTLCEWDEDLPTFRRKHLGTIQESKIDHAAWTGSHMSGVQVVKDGRFTLDHIPITIWVDMLIKTDNTNRITLSRRSSMRAGDKGLARKYKKKLANIWKTTRWMRWL